MDGRSEEDVIDMFARWHSVRISRDSFDIESDFGKSWFWVNVNS